MNSPESGPGTRATAANWRRGVSALDLLFWGFLVFLAGFLLPLSTKWFHNIYYALVLAPLLFAAKFDTLRNFHRSPLVNLWYALLAYQLLSYAWSLEYSADFVPLLKRLLYLYALGLAVFALLAAGRPLNRWVILAAPLAIALVALASMLWFYSQNSFPQARFEASGRLSNPIFFGAAAAAFSAAALVNWRAQSRAYHLLLALAVAINLSAIYLTQSRSALLGLLICIAGLVLLSPRTRLLAVAAACVLGLLALVIDWQPLLARGLSYRPEIWLGQWQRMSESCNLLVGCGLGVEPAVESASGRFDHPHSVYLAWLVYSGVLGLGGYLLAIGLILRSALRDERLLPWIAVLMVGLGVTVTDGDKLLESASPVWLLIHLPVAVLLAEHALGLLRQPEKVPTTDDRPRSAVDGAH